MGARATLALVGCGAVALLGGVLWLARSVAPTGRRAAAQGASAAAAPARTEGVQLVDPATGEAPRGAASAAPAESGGAAPRLVGRVVDERGRGVRDVWLALVRPDADAGANGWRTLAEAPSAADGAFAFPLDVPEDARVRAAPPYGWTIDVRELPARPPLEFRARPVRRAPLRIELVDAATDEPVPDAHLAVRPAAGGGHLLLETDARGAAQSELELEEGELRVGLVHESFETPEPRQGRPRMPPIAHDGDPEARPTQVRVHVGPTLRLDLRLPPDVEPHMLHAVLLAPGRATLDHEARAARVALRQDPDGGPPWVRFLWHFAYANALPQQSFTLVVRDNALRYRAAVPVPARMGVHPELVTVALQAACSFAVEVRAPDDTPLQGALVELRDANGDVLASERTGVPGDARFVGVPAGSYTLATSHRACVDDQRPLRAAPGASGSVRVVLEPATVGGAISGRVVARERLRSFAGSGGVVVRLVSSEDPLRRFELPLAWDVGEEGVWTAAFRFDDVPAGRYQCDLNPTDPRRVWPSSIEVAPPRHGLLFAEHEAGALLPLCIDVVGAEGGELLGDAKLWARAEGVRDVERWAEGIGSPFVPADAELEWAVGAPGRAPRFGDRDALRIEEGALAARCSLQPGFGLRLELRDGTGTPLAGVAARLDGAPAGTSDAEGRLVLTADAAPASLTLEHARWGAPDDLEREFADAVAAGLPHLVVVLRPR